MTRPLLPYFSGTFPVLPLKNSVLLPHMVAPFFFRKNRHPALSEESKEPLQQIVFVTQRDAALLSKSGLFTVGTRAEIVKSLFFSDGGCKLLAEGRERVLLSEVYEETGHFFAKTAQFPEQVEVGNRLTALVRVLLERFQRYTELSARVPEDLSVMLQGLSDPSQIGDIITAHLELRFEDKQRLLEERSVQTRLFQILSFLENEFQLLQLEHVIKTRVKNQLDKNQREYFLQEQLKAIQQELGRHEGGFCDPEQLKNKIEQAGFSTEARERALEEGAKLKLLPPFSGEAGVIRTYLEWLFKLPWKKRSLIKRSLMQAALVLDEAYYGLDKVKERILEYLAVELRKKKVVGPILCLVGPPGTGKTSLGAAIARATGRKYVRIALGGLRDEAEIRGHRRTYVGALPGKIMQFIARSGVKNPLVLLDEIDKIGGDFRGDPASVLLELLDPEQNSRFHDHYLAVDFDLSEVLFVASANHLSFSEPLKDRMEIIRLSGYTDEEKYHIAKYHLLPKQRMRNGIDEGELHLPDETLSAVIRSYTKEAGVRKLEQHLGALCRKVVKLHLENKRSGLTTILSSDLPRYLGNPTTRKQIPAQHPKVGCVTGLAWTALGGELLTIEASAVPGKGKLLHTGSLGAVMKESVLAALTVVRSRASVWKISSSFFETQDIHLHVPEGSTPKDGPSAGIAMCLALFSTLAQLPVKPSLAMTGEITLQGHILPIGGLKEKLLAARSAGIKEVLLPLDNQADLLEIPEQVWGDMTIHWVQVIDEVLQLGLQQLPEGMKPHAISVFSEQAALIS